MNYYAILFWVVHIVSIITHARLWYLEYKYCRHREYFGMPGMIFFLLISTVPVVSTFMAFGGSWDYMKNMIEELEKE